MNVRLVRDTVTPDMASKARMLSPIARRAVLAAMARSFAAMTREPMGASGKHRPQPWAPLSEAYAKRIGRTEPTLVMTASERVAEGKDAASPHLRDSVQVQSVTPERAVVGADIEYAAAHQLGSGVPPRLYFPVFKNNTLTRRARAALLAILKAAIKI